MCHPLVVILSTENLSHLTSFFSSRIRKMFFGHGSSSQYLIVLTQKFLTVWNLLTCSGRGNTPKRDRSKGLTQIRGKKMKSNQIVIIIVCSKMHVLDVFWFTEVLDCSMSVFMTSFLLLCCCCYCLFTSGLVVWWSIEAKVSELVSDPCGPYFAAFVMFNNNKTHCKYGYIFAVND